VNIDIDGRPTLSVGVCAPALDTAVAAQAAAIRLLAKKLSLMLSSWLLYQLAKGSTSLLQTAPPWRSAA
jgi:hypothetical protein